VIKHAKCGLLRVNNTLKENVYIQFGRKNTSNPYFADGFNFLRAGFILFAVFASLKIIHLGANFFT
jgi:hypothetical protein